MPNRNQDVQPWHMKLSDAVLANAVVFVKGAPERVLERTTSWMY
ncbi:MAG: hypothetical protein SGI77_18485 [Pirellulaceae bacterium]|nr:hypothetical protein [Pirellulaceae bacterium]